MSPGGLRSALLFAPSAFACGLGVWQVQRLEQKKTELEYRHELLGREPLDLNSSNNNDGGGSGKQRRGEGEGSRGRILERHTPVTCRGKFLHDRSIFVGPRVRSELGQAFQGYMVVTPLELEGGRGGGKLGFGSSLFGQRVNEEGKGKEVVLVLRGWVPQAWKDEPERFEYFRGGPDQVVQVQGLVKPSDNPGYFAPANLPEIGQWFFYDVPAMARACGVGATGGGEEGGTILVEEVDMEESAETKRVKLSTAMDVLAFRTDRNLWKGGELPAGDAARVDRGVQVLLNKLNTSFLPIQRTLGDFLRFNVTPQDHINYALTWFTLAFCTSLMAYARLRSAKTGKSWWFFARGRRAAAASSRRRG